MPCPKMWKNRLPGDYLIKFINNTKQHHLIEKICLGICFPN